MEIPVIYLSSEFFSRYMAVSMISLLENKNSDTFYQIYVLVEKQYSSQALAPFERMRQNYTNFSITWVMMDEVFSDTIETPSGVGKETLYRLLAAERLPHIDRCIYLDSDTIVENDLTEMYLYDTGDAYISGIYPQWFLARMKSEYQNAYGKSALKMLEKNMGLVSFDQYVGAGVMIMNLARLRDDHMAEDFLKQIVPNSMPRDQDILNICCYGHIAKLPFKFCVDLHELSDLDWYQEHNEEMIPEIQKALLCPVVIHFSDRFKPWRAVGIRYSRRWWHYAMLTGLAETLWNDFLSCGVFWGEAQEASPQWVSDIYQKAYAEFSKGGSYRIGRFITWLPRKILNMFGIDQIGKRFAGGKD